MQDAYGRQIRYLRLSITSACSMRCLYCRPVGLERGDDELTAEEIERLVRHLAERHGVEKVRLTGGEPTARADLVEIVARIAGIEGIGEVAMTTNGLTMVRQAGELARAGLRRVNISLDSLDSERFSRITGVDALARVLGGIDAALAAGLHPVRLNAVVVRGENEDEICELLGFAAGKGVEIRFIELMPMGPLGGRWAERFVSEAEMRERLGGVVQEWKEQSAGADSARRYRVRLSDGTWARVGFIAAMSCPFCGGCDRIRIGADGTYYPCLMDRPAGSVMGALRPVFDAQRLDEVLRQGLSQKSAEHPAMGVGIMTRIGG